MRHNIQFRQYGTIGRYKNQQGFRALLPHFYLRLNGIPKQEMFLSFLKFELFLKGYKFSCTLNLILLLS